LESVTQKDTHYLQALNCHTTSRWHALLRGADKSLARPGKKQATATEDLMFIYPTCNYIWRNISAVYIHNKTSIKRNILTIKQKIHREVGRATGWGASGAYALGPDEKKNTTNYVFDFVYKFCLKYILLYEELREIWSQMYIGLHVKYPLFLSDFNKTWIFSTDFLKIVKYQVSWKSVQWEPSCSMPTDWHDKANSRFSWFCEITSYLTVNGVYLTTIQNTRIHKVGRRHNFYNVQPGGTYLNTELQIVKKLIVSESLWSCSV
jgi:hypothetical protein